MTNLNGLAMNPDYPYLDIELKVNEDSARLWLRVAERMGKQNHPAAQIMRDNLAIIERQRNGRAAESV